MRRRLYLATLAGATVGSIAGCSGDGDSEGSDGDEGGDDGDSDGSDGGTGTETETASETTSEPTASFSERWSADLETNTASGGLYAVDASAEGVVVGSAGGVEALSTEGDRRWYWAEPREFENPGFGTVLVEDDAVFTVANAESVVAALDPGTGAVQWRRDGGDEGAGFGGVTVGDYFATSYLESGIAVLDRGSGDTVATIDALNPNRAVGYDGTLVVPGIRGTVGYDPATGQEAWSIDAAFSNTVGVAGTVLVGANSGELIGVDLDAGEQVWTASLPEDVSFPTVVAGEETALVQWRRPTETVRAVDVADGSTRWESELDLQTIPFPPVVDDGTAVVDVAEGYVAFDAETGAELATASQSGIGAINADAATGVFYACSTSVTAYDL